jgi:hypothetical protein
MYPNTQLENACGRTLNNSINVNVK